MDVLAVVRLHLAAALLSLPRLVVLKPVEDILSLDLSIPPELGGDVLDLVRRGGPGPTPIKLLERPQLLRGWVPTRAHHNLMLRIELPFALL